MKFTIIVPVYGVEKYLDACVSSLLDQTYTAFEVILVDDRSPDRCPEMCDQWQMRDDRIRVIHKPVNEGLGFARNTGIAAARGEYILFVDSDDYLASDTLEQCEKLLEKSTDILVFGMELRYENPDGTVKMCDFILPEDVHGNTAAQKAYIFSRLSAKKVFPYACNKVYRRQFLLGQPTRFEQTKLIEDFLFNISVFEYAKEIRAISKAFYIYRKPAHETLASRYSSDFFSLSKRKFLLEEAFLHNCGAMTEDHLNRIYCSYVKHLISTVIKNRTKAAGLSKKQQKQAADEMLRDPLTVRVMKQMKPRGLHYKLLCVVIRGKHAGLLLGIGGGVCFMQKHLLPLYRKFT